MTSSAHIPATSAVAAATNTAAKRRPVIIVNADDWGGAAQATDRILECVRHGVVSSASAMVFMEDSERAASLAREHNVDTGLHLNLTHTFSAPSVPSSLIEQQRKLSQFLCGGRRGVLLFNPLLMSSFQYVIQSQLDEYERLYGRKAQHIDGHHHAHLCANVFWQGLIPKGTIVRRNFTFFSGEKGALNRAYRSVQDKMLARHHQITDYFFNLDPIDDRRLREIAELARNANVEIETHPERPHEYKFLMDGGLSQLGCEVARAYRLRSANSPLTTAPKSEAVAISTPSDSNKIPHIAVCICTYQRPAMLSRLLSKLGQLITAESFTWSIVIADNDEARSGEAAVEEARASLSVPVKYCSEPRKGISNARNTVIANAEGDYVALIDDDEFPVERWLLLLLETLRRYNVDGVLGPVIRHFDEEPPRWLKQSSLYDRPVHPTGEIVAWRGARTGNALLKRSLFDEDAPFRVELVAGEDQDFFRRKIEEGHSFVWSAEAVVYETLPPPRWKRMYFVRKAFLHGSHAAGRPDCGPVSILKSIIAVPLYTLGLPVALLAGQQRFMTLLVKLCDHAGKLLSLVNIRPVHDEYVSE